MANASYCMVMVTTDAEEKAVELAKLVVSNKLAACVQLTTIRSVYTWEGAVEDSPEVLLLMKTHDSKYAELEAFIKAHHDYDTPEILKVPVTAGFGPYLSWVDQNTIDE